MPVRRVLEFAANGFDENLQGIGQFYGGIRIPTLPTSAVHGRYLFQLASFQLPEGIRAKIVGYRQSLSIGYVQNQDQPGGTQPYANEFPVTTSAWRFVDGDVTWHLRQLGALSNLGIPSQVLQTAVPVPGTAASTAYRYASSGGSALLYESMALPGSLYVDLTAYTPPNGGKPWGVAVENGGDFFTFYSLRTTHQTWGAWTSLDIDVEGPNSWGFFASVYQTNPATRQTLTIPTTVISSGIGPEEAFLANFPYKDTAVNPGAQYFRIGGSLIVEYPGD
jgi:hypothetical protein